ncbi:hypothetical protein DYB37_005799 [Aphanomyces astaci]|uniref:WW domain-containing protein n=1 Tax=Aphanomyces astaci TaxID=112090 RepID=A0A418FDM6_APHAT|nr:hypothetical protein DYB37_005799 [Aphanomyces astaci]
MSHPNNNPTVQQQPEEPLTYANWTEYFDDDSGKPYYHHSETKECVWEAPEAFRVEKARADVKKLFDPLQQQQRVVEKEQPDSTSVDDTLPEVDTTTPPASTSTKSEPTAPTPERKDGSSETAAVAPVPVVPVENLEETYKKMTQSEKVATFKALLKSSGVMPKMKWNEAMKLVVNAPAWKVLSSVGEKKQAFAEFTTQLANELNVEKRRKQKTARENFLKLLAGNDGVTSQTRWGDLLDESLGLVTDDRWKDVEDDTERRDLFSTYIADLSRNEREFKRQQRDAHRRTFLAYLRDPAQHPDVPVTIATKLHEVRDQLLTHESIQALELHRADVQEWFNEYMDELRHDEELKKREERLQLRKREDELAAAFKAFLLQEVAAKRLTTASRWRECWAGYEANATYCELKKLHSGMPRDIFEGVMDRLHDALRDERSWLKHVVARAEFVVKYNSTLSLFLQHIHDTVAKLGLEDEPGAVPTPRQSFFASLLDEATVPPSVVEWFQGAHARELERYQRMESERIKKVEAFEEMLMEYYFRSDHLTTSWDQARVEVQHRSAYRALDDGAEVAFQQYMQKLQKKMESLTKSRKTVDATEQPPATDEARPTSRSTSRSNKKKKRDDRSRSEEDRKRSKKSSSKKSAKKKHKRSRSPP